MKTTSSAQTVHTAGGITHTLGAGAALGTLLGTAGRRVEVELRDTVLLPHIERNLLSVSKLAKAGFGTYFNHTGAYIFDTTGKLMLTGQLENDLYSLKFLPAATGPSGSSFFNKAKPAPLMTWHRRLGHLSLNAVRWLAKHAVGVRFSDTREEPCTDCAEANVKRKPHPHLGNMSDLPGVGLHLDLDHADVRSVDHKNYSLTVVDDASRFVFNHQLRLKDETKLVVQTMIERVERRTGRKVKWIRADRGGEFAALRTWCLDRGIEFQHSGTGEHSQNPVAERMHQNIQHKARAMMTTANWPRTRWPHAYRYAADIINLAPARANCHLSPYEIWFGKPPDYDAAKVFGCLAIARKKSEKASTINNRGERCVFVGLHRESKTYLLLRLSDLKLMDDYNVEFFEENFPFQGDQPDTSEPEESGNGSETEDSGNEAAPTDSGNEDSGKAVTTGFSGKSDQEKVRNQIATTTRRYPRRTRTLTPKLKNVDTFSAFCQIASPAETLQALAVHLILNPDPKTRQQAMKSADWYHWEKAEKEELNSLLQNATWELVDERPEMDVIDTKWIYKTKLHPDGTIERRKCRLVARGFQERLEPHEDNYSSTLKMNSIRLVFALAAILHLIVHHLDIKTAFLYGKVNKDIYVRQPPGYLDANRPNAVCKLIKSLYGLRCSPQIWLSELRSTLRTCGFEQCVADPCIMINRQTGVIVACYVDDVLILARSVKCMSTVKRTLCAKYTVRDLGLCERIVGINVKWTTEGILLHCDTYVQRMLETFNMTNCRRTDIPMNSGLQLDPIDADFRTEAKILLDKLPYRALTGSLLYAVVTTRIDIAFAVSYLCRFNDSYSTSHWQAAKQVLRYLSSTSDTGLFYPYGNSDSVPKLEIYSDADYARCNQTRRSVGGTVVRLNGCVVGYSSRRHKCVTRSTCEAEYVQLSDSVTDALWFSSLLGELGFPQHGIVVHEDNQSTIKLASTERITERNKHIEVRHHHIREKVADGRIQLQYCSTQDMLADTLTKPLARPQFCTLRDKLGMRSASTMNKIPDQVGKSENDHGSNPLTSTAESH